MSDVVDVLETITVWTGYVFVEDQIYLGELQVEVIEYTDRVVSEVWFMTEHGFGFLPSQVDGIPPGMRRKATEIALEDRNSDG